jgi:ATP-dependent DNA helicase RecG
MVELDQISGIGPRTLSKLNKLKINTLNDLLYHFPYRYLDFSNISSINQVQNKETITITGKLIKFQNIFTHNHKNLQKAVVQDKTGQINLLWFNQPYLSNNFKVGEVYSFAGTASTFQNKVTLIAPEYGQYNTGKIVAVYPETSGLTSKWFRKTIQNLLPKLLKESKETLPQKILKKHHLLTLKPSLKEIHDPTNISSLNQARNRLAVEEILKIQIQSYLSKQNWLSKTAKFKLKKTPTINKKIDKLIKSLPYKLTSSQKQVTEEIISDLISTNKVTNRLLQGDVGSGKTIVAIVAIFLTSLNNRLSLFIAPTEILANQHYQTLKETLKQFKVPIFLLTGSKKIKLKDVPDNAIIIATHAAIYQKKTLEDKVALLIIDEQHKFGVKQRSFLGTSLNPPHSLTMTATPIPRTISLTMLGNLDLSTITSLPKKRLPIKTFLVPHKKTNNCYDWIKKEIKEKKCQAFIVCPFIEESETMSTVKSAVKEFEILSKEVFPNLKMELIHGKIKNQDREKIIKKFKNNKINILVTTPIIEVGIDIPNASIMLIQSADRFGLAQLHQIRGRVGRGHLQSFCYLFSQSENEKTQQRLEFLENHNNGLKIAEYDLKNRGPGEAFSIIQHGFPSLKLASLSDLDLIKLGQAIMADLIKDKNFKFSKIISEKTIDNSVIRN